MHTRFIHVNLVAAVWRDLAAFYQEVFGCIPVPPERHLEGEWLSSATGVPNAVLEGIHLRLPVGGERGPTLEIFQYSEALERLSPAANRQGLGHIAFEVDDVAEVLQRIHAAGGSAIGERVTTEIDGVGIITFVYATDPEGNIIELQQREA